MSQNISDDSQHTGVQRLIKSYFMGIKQLHEKRTMFLLGMVLTSMTALVNKLRVKRLSPESGVVTCMSVMVGRMRTCRIVQAQHN